MKFINKLFSKIGLDGMKHIIVSSILSCALSLFTPSWIAALITMLIGIIKEIYDKVSKKGCPEWKDLLCDLIGTIIGSL